MVNGRRKYKSDIKYHKVSVKLSDKDFEKLEEDAKATGVDRSKYLRALVQGAGKVDLNVRVAIAERLQTRHQPEQAKTG